MKQFEKDFINFGISVFKSFGLDNLSAKIFSILYIEPKEVSMDDLAKRTGYSLASVSNKMKMFEGLGMAQRVKKPGTKKVYHYMNKSIFNLMKKKFELAYQKEVLPAKEIIPQILEKHKNVKLNKEETEKMKIIKNYYKQMLEVEKMLKSLHLCMEKLGK